MAGKRGITKPAAKPARGKVLIAAPFLNDFYFGRSVVMLADHGKEGSFGLIMNKPLELNFNEIVSGFPDFKAKVFLGGPVKSDNLYFVHTLGDRVPGSARIIDDLYWGGDIDLVQDMMHKGEIRTGQLRFYLGYSGWSPDQLEREMDESSWVLTTADSRTLLRQETTGLWAGLVKKLGGEYLEWIHYPTDPGLN